MLCAIDRPRQHWPPTQPVTVISLYFKSFQSSQEVYNSGHAELSVYKYSLSSMVQNSKNEQIIYIQGTWVVRKQTQALVMPITGVLEVMINKKKFMINKNTEYIPETYVSVYHGSH